MAFHRNDISIHVTAAGTVYVAQGNPAAESVDHFDMATEEFGLYHSQLRHRAVWRSADGRIVIGYPRDIPADARSVVRHLHYHGRLTGQAERAGRV